MVVLAVLATSLPIQAAADEEPCKAEISAMGGIPILLSASGLDCDVFAAVVRGIQEEFGVLERMMSAHTDRGTVATINRQGPTGGPCPGPLAEVLATAADISAATGGAFDITVRPLLRMWKRAAEEQRLPTPGERRAALDLVGWQALELHEGRVRIAPPGVTIDLGGIAKGYFGDVAVQRLREAGATRCIADVGADLVTWKEPDQHEFQVGVRNPWGKGLMGVITAEGGAVVTSGDYERYLTIGDRRICHIIDPRTGEPVEGVHSVTVLAPTGVEADALATGIFVLGHDAGSALVEAREGVEALIVADDPAAPGQQRVFISSGLAHRFAWHDDVVGQ